MSFVVPQIKPDRFASFFYIVFQYSALHLPGWPFPHNYSFFQLARVPTLFPEKEITMYTNKQVPTGALIILITQNLAGAELREAETDVAGPEKEKPKSRPSKSVEISTAQV